MTAVDLTESMLAVARKNRLAGLVKFEAADATRLRFEADRFDVTCISFALHDMPLRIREGVMREMRRVTKPDGAIVIVDYDLPRSRLGRRLIHFLIGLYEGKYYREFISSDLDSLLEDTGIRAVAKTSVLMGAGRILKAARLAAGQKHR